MSKEVEISVTLEPEHAAALFRLCDKFSHTDARQYLYPHLPRDIRDQQAYQMVIAADRLHRALRDAGVESAWPWIEGACS